MDRILKLLSIVPILALSMSAFYFSRLFGFSSPWLSILEISDYFNKASEFIIFPLIIFSLSLAFTIIPKYLDFVTIVGNFTTRLNLIPNKLKIATNLIAVSVFIVASIMLPKSYLYLTIGTAIIWFSMSSAKSIISFMIQTPSESIIIVAATAIKLLVIAILIVEFSVQGIRFAVLNHDIDRYMFIIDHCIDDVDSLNSDSIQVCDSWPCSYGELYIDRIAAGVLTYQDGSLSLFSENGERVVTQRYSIDYLSMSDSYFCSITRPMFELELCKLNFYQKLTGRDSVVTE